MPNNEPRPLGLTTKKGPRRFYLQRIEDATGISGTGRVAEGVQWSNGWCSVVWLTTHTSVVFYLSMDEVVAIHGHAGKTQIEWADCEYCDHPIDAHWMDNCGACDRAFCPCVLMGQDQQLVVQQLSTKAHAPS